ncbi:MAG: hypothetical protein ACLT9S_15955 [Faecalibacterium sp.]
MINLPDVLPSIVYENPNARRISRDLLKSAERIIEGITGQKLYDGLKWLQLTSALGGMISNAYQLRYGKKSWCSAVKMPDGWRLPEDRRDIPAL